jgi:small-conductance mechanosensitive channel
MDEFEQLAETLRSLGESMAAQLSSGWIYIQLGLLLLAALVALGVSVWLRKRVDFVALVMGWPSPIRLVLRAVFANLALIIFVVLAGVTRRVMLVYTAPSRSYLISVAASLATAWLVIHLIAGLVRNQLAVRIVAIVAWTIAALSILGILDTTIGALDSLAITVGGLRLSLLLFLKVIILMLAALWVATTTSNFLDTRIHLLPDLTPSVQVLISKLVRLTLITLAILAVLSAAGIDISAIAIFSGAVGVGVGFGLQKIVSNFVSGIILLADKSIKPGDVVTVGDSFGWVTAMNTRYISVVTRDGREVLIPNEDLVTQRVINWSYSKDDVRLELKFGVDVASDPHQARRVAVAAATTVPRVLPAPVPVCHFVEFSGKSLDFSLRFWIKDPIEGTSNVRGDVLLAMWDAFQREGIKIPSPVQDMRLREMVRVSMQAEPPVRGP